MKCSKHDFKSYNKWLSREISDYIYSTGPDDSIESSIRTIERYCASRVEIKTQKQTSNTKETVQRSQARKFSADWDMISIWRKLPATFSESFILCLDVSSISNLFRTCKFFHKAFDTKAVWTQLGRRDYANLRIKHDFRVFETSAKQLYRFSMYQDKGDFRLHSAALLQSKSKTAVELTENLVDVMCIEGSGFAQPVQEFVRLKSFAGRFQRCWQSDLKLSWFRQRNDVCIWLAGMDTTTHKESWRLPTTVPLAQIFKQYQFFPEHQLCDAFFLAKSYLVIEAKEACRDSSFMQNKNGNVENELEQDFASLKDQNQKCFHIFSIIDLKKEFQNKMKGEENNSVFKVGFCQKDSTDPDGQDNKLLYQDYQNIRIYKGHIQGIDSGKSNIKVKKIGDSKIVFFSTNTNKPFVMIFDTASRACLFQAELQLNFVLLDLFVSRQSLIQSKIVLFALDKELFAYSITPHDLFKPTIHKLNFSQPQQQKEDDAEAETTYPQNFSTSKRQYYYNLEHDHNFASKQISKEYLLVFRSGTFHVINFNTSAASGVSCYSKDWDVYNGRVFVLSQGMLTCRQIDSYGLHPSCNYHYLANFSGVSDWVLVGPCYTVTLGVSEDSPNWLTFNVSISPTDNVARTDSVVSSVLGRHKFIVENMPLGSNNKENTSGNQKEEVTAKLEGTTLFIKTSTQAFFCELEAFSRPKTRYLNPKNKPGDPKIVLNVVEKPENKDPNVENAEKKQKFIPEILENYNHLSKSKPSKRKNIWKNVEKKTDVKELMAAKRIVRGKGDRYFKNVRHEGRGEKDCVY